VQEDNQPPFRISCTVESKYSRCVPLAKGESFDARRGKHGLEVYYQGDKGKTRKQFYTLVASDAKASQPAAAAAVATQPVPVAASGQSSPAPAPTPPAVAAQQIFPERGSEKVKCNFASTPAGADINLDGKYVGNTPSEIAVSTGTHVVIFSMSGFSEWRRELTVETGSGVVNVTASLQKTQP